MENREEKWNKMKEEYRDRHMTEGQVNQMKEMIEKAKKENQKNRKKRILKWGTAAAAVTMAVLPNTSSDIAYAMSRIPVLSKWVEVVTLQDYEYDDGRQTADISVPEIVPQIPTEQEEETGSDIQVTLKKTSEEINAEIKAVSAKLIEEFKEGLKNREGYQTMQVKSEVAATTEEYFTLKLICYQAAGSGYEEHHFYTIDLKTGERMQLKDIFTEGSDYIAVVSETIKEQMRQQMAADENVIYNLDTDIPEWNFNAITEETSFYLNENGELVICFNEGEVAPMYMGCVEFVIPNDKLEDIRRK